MNITVPALALVAALALSACGSSTATTPASRSHMRSSSPMMSSGSSMPMTSGSSSSGPTAPAHNSADSAFTASMLAQHQQVVQMAVLAATHARSPQLKALAAQIAAEQSPQITMMNGWRHGWGMPMMTSGSAGHMGSRGHSGTGMMSAAEMTKLMSLSGAAFDNAFLQLMTAHHTAAITMARTEQSAGKTAVIKKLAASIDTDQSTELRQMKAMMTARGLQAP